MAESPMIDASDLGFVGVADSSTDAETQAAQELSSVGSGFNFTGLTLKDARFQVEGILLQQALERAEGNVVKAAEDLAVSRPTLYDLLKRHGLTQAD
jgi:two-component system NtrC family response regulator